ncbi:MAG TPA: hypothetical protein PLX45_05430 [Piscinibacter sp.]|nr:hypothetical protein [Piscinibacter sp.]HPG77238.1 hypothetical protein [Piscinibacter sp.]HPM65670.1 hypothetical protein [Piscinibacter sp.]
MVVAHQPRRAQHRQGAVGDGDDTVAGEAAAREALLRGLLEPRQDATDMPAWQAQPAVAQGIRSLYLYLSALR